MEFGQRLGRDQQTCATPCQVSTWMDITILGRVNHLGALARIRGLVALARAWMTTRLFKREAVAHQRRVRNSALYKDTY